MGRLDALALEPLLPQPLHELTAHSRGIAGCRGGQELRLYAARTRRFPPPSAPPILDRVADENLSPAASSGFQSMGPAPCCSPMSTPNTAARDANRRRSSAAAAGGNDLMAAGVHGRKPRPTAGRARTDSIAWSERALCQTSAASTLVATPRGTKTKSTSDEWQTPSTHRTHVGTPAKAGRPAANPVRLNGFLRRPWRPKLDI